MLDKGQLNSAGFDGDPACKLLHKVCKYTLSDLRFMWKATPSMQQFILDLKFSIMQVLDQKVILLSLTKACPRSIYNCYFQ